MEAGLKVCSITANLMAWGPGNILTAVVIQVRFAAITDAVMVCFMHLTAKDMKVCLLTINTMGMVPFNTVMAGNTVVSSNTI